MGRKLPAGIANQPELLPGLELYREAFYQLDTERTFGQHGPNPIPHSRILAHGRRFKLKCGEIEDFCHVIRKLDDWHLLDQYSKIPSGKP